MPGMICARKGIQVIANNKLVACPPYPSFVHRSGIFVDAFFKCDNAPFSSPCIGPIRVCVEKYCSTLRLCRCGNIPALQMSMRRLLLLDAVRRMA